MLPEIPNEYQLLEYIESTGEEYINTGFKYTQYTKIICDCIVYQNDMSYEALFGARNGYNSYMYTFFTRFNNGAIPCLGSYNKEYTGSGFVYDTKIHIVSDEYKIEWFDEYGEVLLGSIEGTTSRTWTCNYPLTIFTLNHAGNGFDSPSKTRMYRFQIYESETLARDYVPCYRIEDDVVGLFDLVDKKFYTNERTSGGFIKGPNATEPYFILCKDNQGFKYYNKETKQWEFLSNTLEEDMFVKYGYDRFLTDDGLSEEYDVLFYRINEDVLKVKSLLLNVVPQRQTIRIQQPMSMYITKSQVDTDTFDESVFDYNVSYQKKDDILTVTTTIDKLQKSNNKFKIYSILFSGK